MSFLTELVPFNVCIWPRGKYKIDQREQENCSRESLWLCELLLDMVVLPDIKAWFTLYSGAWGMQIQTSLLKIPGADGEKQYGLDLVQMLRTSHIFWLLQEGINNTNSSPSTEMQESSPRQSTHQINMKWFLCVQLLWILCVVVCGSAGFFFRGYLMSWLFTTSHTKSWNCTIKPKFQGSWEAKNDPVSQLRPNMQFCLAAHSMLKMSNFTFLTDK